MDNLFLVRPSKEYKQSFKEYVLAYKAANDEYYFNKYSKALVNFDAYLDILELFSKEITTENEVITSNFWLIYNNNVAGVVRIRHEEIETAGHIGYDISPKFRNQGIGTRLLRLALIEAKKIGITEAILTCSVENIASRKIIEKNGGRLLGTIYDYEDEETLYRFGIKL